MTLIADSGSTKTHWCLMKKGAAIQHFYTKGINPFYQTSDEVGAEIDLHLMPEIKHFDVSTIYFYGAGCSFPEKKAVVADALRQRFQDASIDVQSDLLAAARSLFQHSEGIACILGTGSNSCYYNGVEIAANVSPLGFILGDEGSGAVLVKAFVADCLKNQVPSALKEKFLQQYELTPALILEKVYKQPFPNRFLASLTPFLLENKNEPSIYKLVMSGFDAFFQRNVMGYTLNNLKVSFVGSMAYYFADILKISAIKNGIELGKIVQSPMDGLLNYHS
ncbi:MAG: ATPase [Porphyromonadaceae bacterium CG2_30_38_12]|nr:MAG: ATPase [Porphyromonadaceae bacterium CG2_30_38_12]